MKSTFLIQNTPDHALQTLKSALTKAQDHLSLSHQKFLTELQKYQQDKPSILKKIMSLAQVHELILIEFCTGCENADVGELGAFVMKMHLQNGELVRWMVGNLGVLAAGDAGKGKEKGDGQGSGYERERRENQRREKQNQNNFYRIKQNSLFAASGISQQITKIQNSLQYQKNFQRNEIDNILKNRQLIERIEPSDNEHLLYQAVDIISHHSEVFKKLTKDNKEQFANAYRDLNLKPYSKLKQEIDQAMKEKIVKANERLFKSLTKYIVKREENGEQGVMVGGQAVGVQVNFTKEVQDRLVNQDKRKAEKIKELNIALSHEKKLVEKLKNALSEKVKHFQERLIRARFDKAKDNHIAILKKSITEITSIHNLRTDVDHDISIGQTGQKQNEEPFKKSLKINRKKKVLLNDREENLYQKSLMRIQFNLGDNENCDDSAGSQSESQKQCSLNLKSKKKICNQQSEFCYNPKESLTMKSISCRSIESYKQYMRSRFSFCLNVYDYGINLSSLNPNPNPKNSSMLTITNLKHSMSRDNGLERRSVMGQMTSDRQSIMHPKSAHGHHRTKNKMKSYIGRMESSQKEEAIDPMITIMNKLPQFAMGLVDDEGKMQGQGDLEVKEQSGEKFKRLELRKIPMEKFSAKNNFEHLYFDDDAYAKNKGRLNAMMTELKRKRYRREGCKSSGYDQQNFNLKLQPESILELYLNQENAMEAELEYGVSASALVADRKNHKEIFIPGQLLNSKNQEYFDEMTKKISKALYKRGKKDSKLYLQIQNAIKHPFSIIKGTLLSKLQTNQDLSENQIKNFIRFTTNLHYKCQEKPCEHFIQFFSKLGLALK